MSGYRMCLGYTEKIQPLREVSGKLVNIDELPIKTTGTPPTKYTPLELIQGAVTGGILSEPFKRFGAGIELQISRNRNNNYHQDIGQREFTAVTSGMFEGDWSVSGVFCPDCVEWLKFAFNCDTISISSTSTFVDSDGTVIANPQPEDQGYVKNGSAISLYTISYREFSHYKPTSTGATVQIFQYDEFEAPKVFDMAYAQINSKTANGGLNEYGILCGCAINSVSISYDSGSEAAVQFSVDGHFLVDYLQPSSTLINMNTYIDNVSTSPLVAGCLSTSIDGSSYTAIAQTENAGISISNNLYKLGNCLKLTYSSYSQGALSFTLDTTTYSNNPAKYLKTMYGYETLTDNTVYHVAKQPKSIQYMKIRSDDTSATVTTATQFLDINMEGVFVGGINRSYNVDNALMDSPDIRPRHLYIAVGYTSA